MEHDDFRTWIGREQSITEVLSPRLAHQFHAVFDGDDGCGIGAQAPLMVHFCLGQNTVPTRLLGEDGHLARGDFLPPVPLPRRMRAGGAIYFHDRMRVGDTLKSRARITDVVLKQGRTGPLYFITIDNAVTCDGRLILHERQDIVYRDASPPGRTGPGLAKGETPAPRGTHSRTISPTPALLFRYSAVTFNAHRIHYDLPYARDIEGYPGLVVHGPLQATLLCHYAAEIKGANPARFRFRSLRPVFDTADFTINAEPDGDGLKLWTAQDQGPIAMEAHAQW